MAGLEEVFARIEKVICGLSATTVVTPASVEIQEAPAGINPIGAMVPWPVEVPEVTGPDIPKIEAAKAQLRQLYESSEWYSARYACCRALNNEDKVKRTEWIATITSLLKSPDVPPEKKIATVDDAIQLYSMTHDERLRSLLTTIYHDCTDKELGMRAGVGVYKVSLSKAAILQSRKSIPLKGLLENIIAVTTISDIIPDELEHSTIPDSFPFTTLLYGHLGARKCFLSIFSGRPREYKQQNKNSILISPDPTGDWSEYIPVLADKIARLTGGKLDHNCASSEIELPKKPSQAQIARWVKDWAPYFTECNLGIDSIRYYGLPKHLATASFGDRVVSADFI